MSFRRALASASIVAGAVVPALLAGGIASAQAVAERGDGPVECRGGEMQWYANPGISFTSGDQTQSFSGNINLNQCIASKYPDITGGDATFSASGRGACPGGVTNGYGSAVINWDNGKSSTVRGSFRATAGAFGFSDARITSGLFEGSTITFAGHPTTNWAACFWGIGEGGAIFDYVSINPTTAEPDLPPCSVTTSGARAAHARCPH
jgi:hypothetical protein